MATVAQSLFGVTPESLMAAREQRLQEQALQFAQLSPMQAAQAGFYTAGSRLGTGIGGLLGAEDPELMRVRQRQQLLQGVNPTDPASLRAAAQKAMEANDFPAAQELASRAVAAETEQAKLESERALTSQRLRERQAASLPERVFAALAPKATPASVKEAMAAGNDVSLLQIPENVKVSTYGQVLKDAGFVEGTPEFQAKMREFAAAELESTKKGKGTKVDVVLPGVKQAGDVTSLRKDLQAITKPYQDQADAATDAIDLANMALKNNNFAAVSSLSRSLAKAAGETQLTGKDVDAFGIDPSLVGRVSDTVSRLSQSRPTEDTLKKLRDLAQALKAKAEGRLQLEEDQLRETARVSGLFNESQINTVFRRRPAQGGGGANTRTTRSGVKYTVEND